MTTAALPLSDPDPTTAPADASRRTAYDRLIDAFGGERRGAQAKLVKAAGKAQPTVAGWATRGVPLDAVDAIIAGAAEFGVALTFDEVAAWIRHDRAAREAAA